jgi:hypothetical protein
MEETADLWQEGRAMIHSYDHDDLILKFLVNRDNSTEGYFALDDIRLLVTEICDTMPSYAEPVPSSRKQLVLNAFISFFRHFTNAI